MNSISLTGRISKKDILTKKDIKILKLSIADQNRNKLNWINAVGFNAIANYGEKYLNVGDLIQIIGVLKIDRVEYKEKNTDEIKTFVEISIDKIKLLSRKNNDKTNENEIEISNDKMDDFNIDEF